ncbi:MAG: hypothetical protein HQL25_00430 [Candidatus Omnitrophica bacterium]|nr:hypothetical protein [Candidatus Omnitrophota bacterium]
MDVLLVVGEKEQDVQILVKLNRRKLIDDVVGLVKQARDSEAFDMVLERGEVLNYVPRGGGVVSDLVLRGRVSTCY